jgi:cytochrome oxidase Cu insertion factor (SCO1/SenC/PrrC family)
MFKKMFPALLAGLLTVAMIVPGCKTTDGNTSGGTPNYGNRVGNLAYDFTLKDLNGDTVTLSSLLGQPVMLNFWDTA